MLPPVIDEKQVFTFKFWFGDKVQTGMHYQNELFCQIATLDISQRSHAYQQACKLAQQGILIVITCSAQQCHMWGSLRNETVKQLLVDPNQLVTENFSSGGVNRPPDSSPPKSKG